MSFKGIIRGTLFACIIAALIILLSAALTYFSVIDERTASIAVFAGAVGGVFIGALLAAKLSENKVLINALSVSIFFVIILIAASVAVNKGFHIHTRTYAILGSVFAAGILGAIFGR